MPSMVRHEVALGHAKHDTRCWAISGSNFWALWAGTAQYDLGHEHDTSTARPKKYEKHDS
ncbi:hypothetical protein TorRG33x02_335540, partial [Trema orientale]